jgi:transcriptional regulator of acetoin/glycerol metabolism
MTARPHPSGADHYSRRTPERIKRGPASHAAKLCADDIARLYRYADAGWRSFELASHFGVSRITIWRHLKARTTFHVKE